MVLKLRVAFGNYRSLLLCGNALNNLDDLTKGLLQSYLLSEFVTYSPLSISTIKTAGNPFYKTILSASLIKLLSLLAQGSYDSQ